MELSNEKLLDLYRSLLVFRAFELKLGRSPAWHSAIGEDAASVGTFYGLRKDDVIAVHFRGGPAAYWVKGMSLDHVFGSLLSRAEAPGGGKGLGLIGSLEDGILPTTSAVLGPSLALATGAALAFKLQGSDRVAVVTFGDGASNRGEFHECLNMASALKLPVIFVCISNGFAITLRASRSTAIQDIGERAKGYSMPGVIVDGNDLLAVHGAVQEAVSRARADGGPTLVDCKTYRLHGHVESDAATYRPKSEVEAWEARDPVKSFESLLIGRKLLSEAQVGVMAGEAREYVDAAFGRAKSMAPPPEGSLDYVLSNVFAD